MKARLLLIAVLMQAVVAAAQQYPVRPIRFIVPFPPGGAADIVARHIAHGLSQRIGQQVVVDNRGGASTMIGTELAVRATPDGYTILMGTTALAINPSFYPKIPYDALRDLAPISRIGSTALVLVTNLSLPVTSVKELVALAKARRGQLNFASSGNAGPPHLAGELFKIMTGVEMVHVPYKGSGLALPALVGGQVQLMFATMPSAMPLVKSGKLRAIAVASPTRVRAAPDLPTIAETVPNFQADALFAVLAPAKTPASVIDRLHREITALLERPDFQQQLEAVGVEPKAGTPAELRTYLEAETKKWANVVKRSGATPG
jgi:tripartite-type tricarboxylate transporter receptor subunit TctC